MELGMTDRTRIAEAAVALKRDYGELLTPDPSFSQPATGIAWDRIAAAQDRVGGDRDCDAQLSLDVERAA